MTLPNTSNPAQLLYPDMDEELTCTRKMIALVPDGNDEYRPHEKSMTLGALATHLSELPAFATTIMTTSELDFAKKSWSTTKISRTSERLEVFDKNAATMKSEVEGATWDQLEEHWVMRAGEQVYLDEEKGRLLRRMAINHIAHHRAQLGVYLRLLGVAIPGSYGPSADEKF